MRRIVVKKKALPLDPESLPAPDAPAVFGIDPASEGSDTAIVSGFDSLRDITRSMSSDDMVDAIAMTMRNAGTVTGRMSSSGPSTSNIPRSDDAVSLREGMRSPVGVMRQMAMNTILDDRSSAEAIRRLMVAPPIRQPLTIRLVEVQMDRDIRTMETVFFLRFDVCGNRRDAGFRIPYHRLASATSEFEMMGNIASGVRNCLTDLINSDIGPSVMEEISRVMNTGRGR